MLSKQIIQSCIDDIAAIMDVRLCVYRVDGLVVADTSPGEADICMDGPEAGIEAFVESSEDVMAGEGQYFFKLYDGDDVAYMIGSAAVSARGTDREKYGCEGWEEQQMVSAGKLAVKQLGRWMEAFREKFGRNHFIQELLLGKTGGVDVHNQSARLGIETDAVRCVFVIETEHKQDADVIEMIHELYGKNMADFVTSVDEKSIILVKEMEEEDVAAEAAGIANMLVDMINVETMSKVRVGYGNAVANIRQISEAYKEAAMALAVGKIFYSDKTIIAYNMLGIGRLIYQLPAELCDMFLEEVFGKDMAILNDEETLSTVHKFFELNLNLSETSRQLYLHRNTLAYRLEKIQKATGLDIRYFEDAMTFKLALMVAEYRKEKTAEQ